MRVGGSVVRVMKQQWSSKKSQNPASRHESCSKSSPYYCPFLRALAVPVQMNLQ